MSKEQWGHGFHTGVAAASSGEREYLTADRAILCWDPESAHVQVFEFPPPDGNWARWSGFECTALADDARIHAMDFEQRKQAVFIEALHLIVRDGCNPVAVHRALLNLKEYRAGCAPDMPGLHRGKL